MFPLLFKLSDKKLLFIGGGNVAKRKLLSILNQSSPEVTIISKELHPDIKKLLSSNKITWINSSFKEELLKEKYDFAFICTDDKELNTKAALILKKLGTPVNICDNKELSDFFMPAVISQDDIIISVSTKGKSPALVKKLKEIISKTLKGLK
ncbi:bifunctional precorrin-2 dehydrogenase/sirohydrochlorin ferrochelatase [Deferribacter thermophilus]|uniref:precorrin-2 dehydrogenase/sirohydrochlorin ferrochelatase family protein n=1 Tax=Deferribacter thermophilus TaxID=53573 RepID=UPI003C1EA9A0